MKSKTKWICRHFKECEKSISCDHGEPHHPCSDVAHLCYDMGGVFAWCEPEEGENAEKKS